MANDNEIQLVATIDNDDSVNKIKSDIGKISKKINGQNVNFNITAKLSDASIKTIRNQLSSIKADLSNIKVGDTQPTINSNPVKAVQNSISTVYAEGAKQADVLHRKQLLLQQDYDILAEKIAKSSQNINTVATRDGINYNAQFQQLMSGNIADNDTYNRARDALATIRKEFQLLNAQFSSDLPENAIERYSNRVVKLKSEIDLLAQSYKEFGLNNQQLKSSIDSLLGMKDSLVIPQENDITTKEELSQRTKQYTKIKNIVDEINIELTKQKKIESDFNKEFTQANNKISTSLSKLTTQSNNATFRNNISNPNVSSQLSEIQNLKSRYENLQQTLSTTTNPQALVSIQNELKSLDAEFDKVVNSSKELQSTLRNENAFRGLDDRINKLTASMKLFANANERAIGSNKIMSNGKSFADEWNEISSSLSNGNLDANSLKSLQARFQVFGKEAESAGLKGNTAWGKFANTFKSFSTYVSAYTIINTITNQIRQMTQEVITLDSAMVELRKVSEGTDADYNDFLNSASRTAQILGASVSDVVNATSEFSRAGYNLVDAEELGRVATLYKNIGDGINIEDASKSIVSTLKAFNMEAKQAESVVDMINNVSNNASINSNELGEGLQRTASALHTSNNSLAESISLITTANEVAQDAISVSQGWRTVSMRLRSSKADLEALGEDTEGMAESTAQLRDIIKSISGVDIMIDENNFKSTYQIIKEIGAVWEDISDIDQAALLEKIAGKRQANIVAAAFQNYERLDEIMALANNSAGSAMKEQEEYAKSVQYSLDSLKASYQSFSQSIIKSDWIKSLVDGVSGILNTVTKLNNEFDLLNVLLTVNPLVSGGLVGKGVREFVSDLYGLVKEVAKLVGSLEIVKDIASIFGSAKDEIKDTFGGTFKDISGVIDRITDKVKKYNKEREDAAKATQNAFSSNESLIDSEAQIDSLIAEYTTLLSSAENTVAVKEQLLTLQERLNGSYENEVEGLDLVNNSYGENLKLLRERNDLLRQNWIDENQDAINNAKQKLFGYREVDLGNLSFTSYGVDNALSALNSMIDAFEHSVVYGFGQDYNNLAGIYSGLMSSWDYVTYGHALETRDILSKQKEEAESLYEVYRQYTNEISANAQISESDYQTFNNLVEKYKSLQNTLSTTDSLVTMGNTSKELQLVEKELNAFGDKSVDARNMVNSFFENFKTGSRETADVMAGNLEEYEKELGTIDKFNNAIKTLSDGGRVSAKDIWSLIDSDTEHQITFLDQSTEGITTNLDNMVKAKDTYIEAIKKSVIARQQENIIEMESIKKEIKLLEAKRLVIEGTKVNSPADAQDFVNTTKRINSLNSKMKDFQKAINDDNLFINELNTNLGYTAGVVDTLQNQAKDYLNAYKDKIDEISDGLEKEKDVLEKQKDELNEQLNILKEQQKQIEAEIKRYDDLANYVKDIIDEEIDGINNKKQEQEDAYKERIEQIKSTYDAEINGVKGVVDQHKKSLEIQEKELALRNAGKNKQRVYNGATGGFVYQTDIDAVQKAKDDLRNTKFEQSTSDHISLLEKQRDDLVKQLEEERDLKIKDFESEIEKLEEYADAWSESNKIISNSDSETLAVQIFGSNYREQIKRKDTNILNTFKNNYTAYNKSLDDLVNNEITTLEKSIKAKDDEIKAKDAQIQSWRDYKTEVENSATAIENSLSGYSDLIKQVALDENSTFEDRANALENFKNKYVELTGQIQNAQNGLKGAMQDLPSLQFDTNMWYFADDLANFIDAYKEAIISMKESLDASDTGFGIVHSEWDAKLAQAANALRAKGYSQGGVADYTGEAMLHGTSQRSETIFNSTDSKKLYNVVHNADNLSDVVGRNLLKALPSNITTNNNNGITNNFQFGNVVADNPVNFAKQMEEYWRSVANKK